MSSAASSASAAVNSGEEIVTALDLLEKQKELEKAAAYVLKQKWGNETSCTFSQGYITQPVYACATCYKNNDHKQFGFCFGCSMNCHVGHEVYELFPKRNFRCDCGTSISNCACELEKKDASLRNENKYSHNFDGLYCWCNQPYSHDSDVVMVKCIVCEDWFHTTCIAKTRTVPDTDDFADFVCTDCVDKLPFLKFYSGYQIPIAEVLPAAAAAATATATLSSSSSSATLPSCPPTETCSSSSSSSSTTTTTTSAITDLPIQQPNGCVLKQASDKLPQELKGNTFWLENWRSHLCRCSECTNMYESLAVSFLTHPEEDFPFEQVDESESEAEDNATTATTTSSSTASSGVTSLFPQDKRGVKREREDVSIELSASAAFNKQLPPIQKMEMLLGYAEFSQQFKEFLAPFAQTGTVVTQEHIRAFFDELKENKKRRTSL